MMLKALTVGLMLGLATSGTPEPVAAQDRTARDRVSGGMTAFRSDTALRRFLTERAAPAYVLPPPPSPPPPPPPPSVSPGSPPPPPPPPTVALAEAMDSVVVTGNSVANPSITNNQVQGVDEGGIVKVSGQNLVILRRGRLFTVSTANGGLTPVDSIDAYPPGVDGSDDWYDEMLIAGDMIVVVGYSYGRGGTELNRFRVSPEGRLTFVDSHHLKSDDYYSDRNYASRLIGSQLIVYSPLSLEYDEDPLTALPGLSRWEPGQDEDQEPQWRRIVSARQVYAPQPLLASDDAGVDALHTVTRCDLAAVRLNCEATVVLGPRGRTFFVSQNAVYVWMGERWSSEDSSMLIRMPLDGGRPGAVQVAGMPLDQFSFRPNAAASRLDILVTGSGGGDAMWSSNFASGDSPALLRLPTLRFGDGSRAAPASDYRALPGREGAYLSRDRFVGDHLFYTLRGPGDAHRLVVAPVDQGEPFILDAEHEIERIEQIGRDGLVIGGDTVTFTTIDLGGRSPAVGDVFSQPNTSQTESRSHAFFYRANPGSADGADGLLGLPTRREVPKGPDNLWASGSVTDVLFLRRQARRLSEFGSLDATPGVAEREDSCVASCVDWYGGARPIFLGNRVFALLGYELVEGDASGEAIREVRRADFIPRDGVSADGRTAAQNPPQ